MDNQSHSSDKVAESQLEDVSNASTQKGKFDWLGCLSIVLVLGILGAIALPNFYYEHGKAKQSEAKQYVSVMNRAQKVKFAENGTFANSIKELELGIKTETPNYKYSVNVAEKAAFHYAVSKNENTKSYVGGVFTVPATNVNTQVTKNGMTTVAIMCITKFSSKTKPPNPILEKGVPICANGTDPVNQ